MKQRLQKAISVLFLLVILLQSTAIPVMAQARCEWAPIDNPSSPDHGKMSYCVGGFDTEEDLLNAEVTIDCTKNCGIWVKSIFAKQRFNIRDIPGSRAEGNNGWYTCLTPHNIDSSVDDTISECIQPNLVRRGIVCAATGLAVAGITTATLGTTAIANAGILATACGGIILTATQKRSAEEILEDCAPEFIIYVREGFPRVCENHFNYGFTLDMDLQSIEQEPFRICDQINDQDLKDRCQECVGSDQINPEGIWTAVGCIPTQSESIIQTIIKIGLSVAGGVALLIILAASFQLSVSQGDPKATNEAKDKLSAAIIGLLFIIFSVAILQFIGVKLFKIPGFGG